MFDEDDAIAFIRTQVGEEISSLYDDDEILNVIDIIWDFYESNGMLEIDFQRTTKRMRTWIWTVL